MVEEKIPIVEHLPSPESPHPDTAGIDGAVGYPGEHAQPSPVIHDGRVIAAPPGEGVVVQTNPSPEQVERLMHEATGEGGRWLGGLWRRWGRQKTEEQLKKAA